jgi:hypothetical protein
MIGAIAGVLTGWFTVATLSAFTFGALMNLSRRVELVRVRANHRRRYFDS